MLVRNNPNSKRQPAITEIVMLAKLLILLHISTASVKGEVEACDFDAVYVPQGYVGPIIAVAFDETVFAQSVN